MPINAIATAPVAGAISLLHKGTMPSRIRQIVVIGRCPVMSLSPRNQDNSAYRAAMVSRPKPVSL